jgi:hypothetical protein
MVGVNRMLQAESAKELTDASVIALKSDQTFDTSLEGLLDGLSLHCSCEEPPS